MLHLDPQVGPRGVPEGVGQSLLHPASVPEVPTRLSVPQSDSPHP